MNSIEIGSSVKCGICKRDTAVSFLTERVGGTAYDLECMHRNALCKKCLVLVRDDSDSILEIHPLCPICSPEAFLDEE